MLTCLKLGMAKDYCGQSGQLFSEGGKSADWFCVEGCGTVFKPHEGASGLDMHIDLERAMVTIEYDRDGKQVRENWRNTGRHSDQGPARN